MANTIPEAELPPRAAFVAPSQLYKTAGASPHGPSVLRLLLPSQLPFSRGSRGPPAPLIPVTSGNECSAPFSSRPFLRQPRLAQAVSRFHQLRPSRACGPIPVEATRRSLAVSLPSRCTALTQIPVGATRPPLAMVHVSALGRFS